MVITLKKASNKRDQWVCAGNQMLCSIKQEEIVRKFEIKSFLSPGLFFTTRQWDLSVLNAKMYLL